MFGNKDTVKIPNSQNFKKGSFIEYTNYLTFIRRLQIFLEYTIDKENIQK